MYTGFVSTIIINAQTILETIYGQIIYVHEKMVITKFDWSKKLMSSDNMYEIIYKHYLVYNQNHTE